MSERMLFVEQFLESLNCLKYLDKFVSYDLTSQEQIQYLDQEILTEIGITKIGDRIRILNKCASLRKSLSLIHI